MCIVPLPQPGDPGTRLPRRRHEVQGSPLAAQCAVRRRDPECPLKSIRDIASMSQLRKERTFRDGFESRQFASTEERD